MVDKLLIRLITLYQNSLSLLIGRQCRFYPTCSQYTKEAIEKHGAGKGSWLGIRRICSCHPWHEGGHDPVPDNTDYLSQPSSKQ
ncbi:MAG TPA: membrane protein insertion efficiency factor YidD [Porticoccaceae bacterium]|jgi:putative membrane protein insertion efficiency factor|nr:membrane protein insertion efficiency factor YidD [Gammaproteobacteria bacterium]HIL61139.1 membrane protein insertion efficiency factor YidD [Porticoccaceae bacterium]